jgi:CheY-like chemotaxis protein
MTAVRRYHFIIVDDSPFDCLIAEKVIQNTQRHLSIKSFQDGYKALDYIAERGHPDPNEMTIIFLDIQMPIMNGFTFVESFEQLPDEITAGYVIFFTTSSINQNDITRGNSYRSVRNFLNKPLTTVSLQQIIDRLVI